MNMQTGFGDAGDTQATNYMNTMIDIMMPVMENSMILAAEYCKACGRDVILPEDMEYASKYCAMIQLVRRLAPSSQRCTTRRNRRMRLRLKKLQTKNAPPLLGTRGVTPNLSR